MEGFGNAKTVRNDNSSRFGKYVTLLINKDTKKIEGAKIFNYLLEKSRINFQASSERNYHVFYHFLKGKDEENLKQNNLIENDKKWVPKDFNYLNQSGCEDVSSLDDVILYNELNDSFKVFLFNNLFIFNVFFLRPCILVQKQ